MRPLIAFLCICWLGLPVQAEIIIDDFDDMAIVSGPINNTGVVVESMNVGQLGLMREIGLGVSRGEIDGQLDSDVSQSSHLSVDVPSVSPLTVSDTPVVGASLYYYFSDFVDLTESGANNALLFDFSSLSTETSFRFLRIWVFDDVPGNSFTRFISPVPESNTPFTLAIPFKTIQSRDGAPLFATFERVYHFRFSFQSYPLDGVANLNWDIALNRIRIGRVPEPNTLFLFVLAAGFLLQRRLR